jgi:hypothetical protein
MNVRIVICIALTISLFFVSCSKKPVASFVFDSSNLVGGDSIIVKNNSTLANTFRWTLPAGTTVTTKDLRLKLDSAIEEGYLKIKLEAFSKNRKLVDETEQSVFVSARKFKVVFWADAPQTNNKADIAVTLNYTTNYIVGFNYSDSNKPNFSSPNVARIFDVPYGKHYYSAVQYTTADSYKDAVLPNTNPPVHIIQVIPSKAGSTWYEPIFIYSDTIIKAWYYFNVTNLIIQTRLQLLVLYQRTL